MEFCDAFYFISRLTFFFAVDTIFILLLHTIQFRNVWQYKVRIKRYKTRYHQQYLEPCSARYSICVPYVGTDEYCMVQRRQAKILCNSHNCVYKYTQCEIYRIAIVFSCRVERESIGFCGLTPVLR